LNLFYDIFIEIEGTSTQFLTQFRKEDKKKNIAFSNMDFHNWREHSGSLITILFPDKELGDLEKRSAPSS
jgi:hypothetical protein